MFLIESQTVGFTSAGPESRGASPQDSGAAAVTSQGSSYLHLSNSWSQLLLTRLSLKKQFSCNFVKKLGKFGKISSLQKNLEGFCSIAAAAADRSLSFEDGGGAEPTFLFYFNEDPLQIIQLSKVAPSPLVSASAVCVIHTSAPRPDPAARIAVPVFACARTCTRSYLR